MHRVLVANRGEIACRVFEAASRLGWETIAVYSDSDAGALHTKLADKAVALSGARAIDTYLNQDKLIAVALEHAATLVHPGYGFLAESASFARKCAQAGLRFVGPSSQSIEDMGDKARAREIAQSAGVSVLPGSARYSAPDSNELLTNAEAIGYPLLVKAAAGGGGIGMRVVWDASTLAGSIKATSKLAAQAFGDGAIYLERYVPEARHVEVQVFGFGDGSAVHLLDRDCSLQRRHQKILEEAPAPALPEAARTRMRAEALALTQALRYEGAGTVEFLYDIAREESYFLEMNTRIQVEHPVTELITGVDLVRCQLLQASGGDGRAELARANMDTTLHAVEVRLYAENPKRNFQPSPGPITALRLPQSSSVRIDTGYQSGDVVSPYFDPMIMKIGARAASRQQAIAQLRDALDELEIAGLTTNLEYLRFVLRQPEITQAPASTSLNEVLLKRYMEQSAP